MVQISDIYDDYVHAIRFALQGQPHDAALLAKRSVKSLSKVRPELARMMTNILAQFNSVTPTRSNIAQPLPVDVDSRLELVSSELVLMDKDPTWPRYVDEMLKSIIQERLRVDELLQHGIAPTKSVLFVGPPGVGKTLAARWLAFKLGQPLMTMDLASVMSSYLGRTGNNIRAVLQYSQATPSVLLLDEFDAVAKRRADDGELGELKRLVTVLLQAIDGWSASGLLVAATNHPDLLDPAIWRRFDRIIEFPLPSKHDIEQFIKILLDGEDAIAPQWIFILAMITDGTSFADISRFINNARRASVINRCPLLEILEGEAQSLLKTRNKTTRLSVSQNLLRVGVSQRRVSQITGLSRDTIRRHDTNDVQERNE